MNNLKMVTELERLYRATPRIHRNNLAWCVAWDFCQAVSSVQPDDFPDLSSPEVPFAYWIRQAVWLAERHGSLGFFEVAFYKHFGGLGAPK